MLVNRMPMLRMMPDEGAAPSDAGTSPTSGDANVSEATPSVGGVEGTSGAVDFSTTIPEEYRDKGYIQELLKNENPQVELFKQFDNLQQALGKPKIGVPKPDAPPEEWEKFKDLLRPETPDKYEMPEPDFDEDKDLAEKIKGHRDEEFIKEMQEAFHKAGAHPDVFKQAVNVYERKMAEALKQAEADQQKQEQDFEESIKKAFGLDKDRAIETAQEFINATWTPEQKALLPNMSNETLLALSINAVATRNKYEKEDTLTNPKPVDRFSSKEEALAAYREALSDMQNLPLNSVEREKKKAESNKIRDAVVRFG